MTFTVWHRQRDILTALFCPNGRITVFPKPIFTTNNKKIKAIPFKPFSTMTQFTKHSRRDAMITLGLVLVWTEKPVTMSMKDWAAHDHHANLLFFVHHPDHDGPGKAIVIGEPNVFRNTDRTQRAILESRMKEMVNSIKKDWHSVWVNKVRAERNSDGKCLELVLRWMVDLVIGGVDGLEIERDTAGQVLKMKDFLLTLRCARRFALACAQLQLELKITSQGHCLDPSESDSGRMSDATSELQSISPRIFSLSKKKLLRVLEDFASTLRKDTVWTLETQILAECRMPQANFRQFRQEYSHSPKKEIFRVWIRCQDFIIPINRVHWVFFDDGVQSSAIGVMSRNPGKRFNAFIGEARSW
ncbi:hypothetical protein K438DRAFT_1771415 [Mycena galopus ATCC 62051]|nr:hypothetical protein K438DRAFT_1771415 [Mycena galopus ATCC 62051]